jgi:hypothetical protein
MGAEAGVELPQANALDEDILICGCLLTSCKGSTEVEMGRDM